MNKPVIRRVTVKSLRESLAKMLLERDDQRDANETLQRKVATQFKLLEEQRKMLVEQWSIERALRHRLEALGSILNGALKVAHVPTVETAQASGSADMALPESPR